MTLAWHWGRSVKCAIIPCLQALYGMTAFANCRALRRIFHPCENVLAMFDAVREFGGHGT